MMSILDSGHKEHVTDYPDTGPTWDVNEITISYNALSVLDDVAFLGTRFSSLIMWTNYALHSGFRPFCLLVGASPEVVFSICLAVLYESLVKWVYTIPGWLVGGSNLQLSFPNDGIAGS
ncbi:hypothetical protein F2Q70_00026525 [Brassica cretica]|uniref:Uncharacterized protein n=1 Tax=Brassica cretica TaxID=69181 RepID=A0A8S9I7M2_BRACR|nr:hypothetical protein F2Q68_00026096 [Brassica cretica]KAF2604669.1 hypothetical protein F2Q70_00026525 [Brassica cretica]